MRLAPRCVPGGFALDKVLSLLLACLAACFSEAQGADADGWPVNGGPYNIRYSPLTQINRDNVAQLKVAWTYDSHDAFKDSEMQSNPIVVDGVLYATTPKLRVVALDAATGREIWTFDPAGGAAPQRRFRHRGVTVYQDRVFFTYRNFLWALDRKTGKPIASFGNDGRIDLREGLDRPAESMSVSASSPGVIFEDMLILGSTVPETLPGSPGHIRAFDTQHRQAALDLPHHSRIRASSATTRGRRMRTRSPAARMPGRA